MPLKLYLRYLLPALLAGTISGCTAHFRTANNIKSNTDTVFLRNVSWQHKVDSVEYTVWNKVFIDPDHQSHRYDQVLDFSDMNQCIADYDLKNLRHFDTSMFPDEWVPLYKYKGKYYIYKPGDTDVKIGVRDSLFVSYFWEPTYFAIDTFEQLNKNQYRLQTKAVGALSGEDTALFDIFIIDPENNIAVWKCTKDKQGTPRYSLLIAKGSAQKFALVVNDANEKPNEFQFDAVDFKKLLRRRGMIVGNEGFIPGRIRFSLP